MRIIYIYNAKFYNAMVRYSLERPLLRAVAGLRAFDDGTERHGGGSRAVSALEEARVLELPRDCTLGAHELLSHQHSLLRHAHVLVEPLAQLLHRAQLHVHSHKCARHLRLLRAAARLLQRVLALGKRGTHFILVLNLKQLGE